MDEQLPPHDPALMHRFRIWVETTTSPFSYVGANLRAYLKEMGYPCSYKEPPAPLNMS